MGTTKITPEFTRTREYIGRYVVLSDDALDVVTLWAMGTWAFSPMCTNPYSYPYLYISAPKGSGKTVLGESVLGSICRNHRSITGVTGPSLFRMIADVNEETGEAINMAPTLAIDEIDAIFNGAKDEATRLVFNAGYKRGNMIPRVVGKQTINYPVFCPKLLMGIDNGHLPDTIEDRCIRINMRRATADELAKVSEFYDYETEDEAAEICDMLSEWTKGISTVFREYSPERDDIPSGRRWEIARSLVQLAYAAGIEARIRKAIVSLMSDQPEKIDSNVRLYTAIFRLFQDHGTNKLTTNQILGRLREEGIQVPGMSGAGLRSVLSQHGASPTLLNLPAGHAGIVDGKNYQRGYHLHVFDQAFSQFVNDDEE